MSQNDISNEETSHETGALWIKLLWTSSILISRNQIKTFKIRPIYNPSAATTSLPPVFQRPLRSCTQSGIVIFAARAIRLEMTRVAAAGMEDASPAIWRISSPCCSSRPVYLIWRVSECLWGRCGRWNGDMLGRACICLVGWTLLESLALLAKPSISWKLMPAYRHFHAFV